MAVSRKAAKDKKQRRRQRRPSWEKYLSADPGQLMLPVNWSELDRAGRSAVEAAEATKVAEFTALTKRRVS